MIDIEKVKEALKECAKWTYAEQLESGSLAEYEIKNEEEVVNKYLKEQEELIVLGNALTELDRLQKKEVPMKVIEEGAYQQLISGAHYTCGHCKQHTLFSGYKFCPNCGTEADWGE